MAAELEISAQAREDVGKGASRRLRRSAEMVPAIVYGGDQEPRNIAVLHKDLSKALENEAFYSSIITLKVGDASEQVILKDLQRHPAKALIMHADFQRVRADRLLTVSVPLRFTNEDKCRGVKLEGGMIQHNYNELEVSCLPKDLPEYIEIDMAEVGLGDSIHISDITLPDGVTSTELALGEDHDQTLVAVLAPRGGSVDDEDEDAEGGEAGGEQEGGEEA